VRVFSQEELCSLQTAHSSDREASMQLLQVGLALLLVGTGRVLAQDGNSKIVGPAKSAISAKQFDMVLSSSASPADRVILNLFESYATCKVHNIKLMSDRVPIAYGFPGESREYRQKYFPNANSSVGGGCIPDITKPSAWVSYCPECRKAEKKYLEKEWQKGEARLKEKEQEYLREQRQKEEPRIKEVEMKVNPEKLRDGQKQKLDKQ
jgi:hypothetical protein